MREVSTELDAEDLLRRLGHAIKAINSLESQLSVSQQSAESWRKRAEAMAAPVTKDDLAAYDDAYMDQSGSRGGSIRAGLKAFVAARLYAIEKEK